MTSGSNNSKLPLKYQILKRMMPVWDRWTPSVSAKIAANAFLTPIKFPIPESEIQLRSTARSFQFVSGKKQIQAYVWNEEKGKKKLFLMHGWASRATHLSALIEQGIQQNFAIYAIDAPGHALSDGKKSDVLQFGQAILDFELQVGKFDGAVGHSMGGTALLYAMSRGLHIPHLTLMAVPAIRQEIMDVYLRKMDISMRTGKRIFQLLEDEFGAPFEKYTALYLAQSMVFEKVHLVYDKTDKEASLKNADALNNCIDGATLSIVESQGHAKMLADKKVATLVLDHFTKAAL